MDEQTIHKIQTKYQNHVNMFTYCGLEANQAKTLIRRLMKHKVSKDTEVRIAQSIVSGFVFPEDIRAIYVDIYPMIDDPARDTLVSCTKNSERLSASELMKMLEV